MLKILITGASGFIGSEFISKFSNDFRIISYSRKTRKNNKKIKKNIINEKGTIEDKKIIKLFHKNKKGIYLDVGCFHPIRQNNTYLMHQLGWKGVNIDLNPLSIELFNIARPNDINICAAVSNKKSTTILYFDHSLSSLNTISKKHILFIKKALGLNKLKAKKIKTYK